MVLLENPANGERTCVDKHANEGKRWGFKRGHLGWDIVGEHDGLPPEHANWDQTTKAWVVDEEEKARHAEVIRRRCMPREDLYQYFEDKIAALEQRIATLEGGVGV
jgi:hypothetical protein